MKLKVRKSLLLGILVLLLVDVLWVGSAALSRYLFTQASYDKPFFTTYFKTSLFTIYLSAFIFWRPWQRLCWCEWRRQRFGETARSGDQERQCLLREDGEGNGGMGGVGSVGGREGEEGRSEGVCLTCEEGGQKCEGGSERGGSRDGEEERGGSEGEGRSGDEEPERNEGEGKCTRAVKEGRCREGEGTNEGATISGDGEILERQQGARCIMADIHPITGGTLHEPSACRDGEGLERQQGALCAMADTDPNTVHEPSVVCMQSVNYHDESEEKKKPLRFLPSKGSMDECPLPKPPVCLLGPPQVRPLCCDLSDLCEEDRRRNEPFSPCLDKYCKVRFKPTIEIREMLGKDSSSDSRKFDKARDCEKHSKKLPVELLPAHKVAVLSLVFGILWFFANYLYGLGLEKTTVAIVNTLSATSGVFVMCLAAIPFLSTTETDRLTIPRTLVTLLSLLGAVLVSFSPSGQDSSDTNKKNAGALLTLGGAVLYALYLVLLRKMVKEPEALEIPMFFGFVGLFDFLLLCPLLVIWHYSGIETFELPPTSNVWTLLLVNGFIGTVLSELLWLWGVFLTSPLLGTLSLSLVTPLSVTYSMVVGHAPFSWMFLLGAVLIIVGFVGVAILDHLGAWDPVWEVIKRIAMNSSFHWGFRSLSSDPRQLSPELSSSSADFYPTSP